MRWTRATIQTPRPAAPPSPRTGKVAAQRPDEVSKVRNPYLIPGQIRTAPLPPPLGVLGVAAAVSRKAADGRGPRANPRHLPQHSRSADHWSAEVLSCACCLPGQIRTAPLPPPPGVLGVAAAVSRKAADGRGLRRIRTQAPHLSSCYEVTFVKGGKARNYLSRSEKRSKACERG